VAWKSIGNLLKICLVGFVDTLFPRECETKIGLYRRAPGIGRGCHITGTATVLYRDAVLFITASMDDYAEENKT